LVSSVRPDDEPGPGNGVMSSIRRTTTVSPSSWIGSLLAKPVAASTAPCWTAARCVKSGYSTISTSAVVRPADTRSASSMIQPEP
jgi:hypothetical protein